MGQQFAPDERPTGWIIEGRTTAWSAKARTRGWASARVAPNPAFTIVALQGRLTSVQSRSSVVNAAAVMTFAVGA